MRAPQNLSIAPMDKLQDSRIFCWQGGGVAIEGGEVTFTNSNIYGNTAHSVRALKSVHRPHGQMLSVCICACAECEPDCPQLVLVLSIAPMGKPCTADLLCCRVSSG